MGAGLSRDARKGIGKAVYKSRRTSFLRLLSDSFRERRLRRLADPRPSPSTSSTTIDAGLLQRHWVDLKGTWEECYEKYKEELGIANVQAATQKNDEAWSFLLLSLNSRREGALPPHMKRWGPPKYWKERLKNEEKERRY
ncbi:MAG: hypothetical protein RXR41_05580 [Candidatus Marsarchaeota archaeon]